MSFDWLRLDWLTEQLIFKGSDTSPKKFYGHIDRFDLAPLKIRVWTGNKYKHIDFFAWIKIDLRLESKRDMILSWVR